ncbi:MAG TPA: 3-oxo-tetronate kinase [Chthoniobacterales bacterium]|nr:3-oxo-tetronate kinase [Chthoniobacterales bacterium]
MPLLGCISDDFTGGTDLANNLVKSGFRTVQAIGLPDSTAELDDVDALVVALKTRTCPVERAVQESRDAIRWLKSLGCKQFYFKYCSTFDSTPRGNIGPVIEVLLDELDINYTIACPAFPDNGRTVYRGHLFVYDQLLNESGMRHHPLTPMTDPNIVRVLQAQTRFKVDLIRLDVVRQGEAAVRHEFENRLAQVETVSITDATSNEDLVVLAAAAKGLKLVTGGSGLALGLGRNFALQPGCAAKQIAPRGHGAILAGSCSQRTLRQIAVAEAVFPAFRIEPRHLANAFEQKLGEVADWTRQHLPHSESVLVYTSGTPDEIAANQKILGVERAGRLCEDFLAEVARQIVDDGVSRLIVAGGETSGAVVSKLGLNLLRIGPEIDPGVPWTLASGKGRSIALALKSGNFGSEEFFIRAWRHLQTSQ